jgi:endogenous inhibitor of DNA gyrase (YacG/DUF329 family)
MPAERCFLGSECPLCGKPNTDAAGKPTYAAAPDFCSKGCHEEHEAGFEEINREREAIFAELDETPGEDVLACLL